jgi:hypothetical protein
MIVNPRITNPSIPKADALIAEFLGRAKVASTKPRWRSSGHSDYVVARLRIGIPDSRTFAGGR